MNSYQTISKNIKQIPEELRDFNWAAFLLTFIWGFKYNAWITFLAIPLLIFQMPLGFNWILLAILQLYCGIKGNEWAFKKDYWKKPKDFRVTQMKWAVGALSVYIIGPLALLTITSRFFKNTDNLIDLLSNAQCVYAHNEVKKDIGKLKRNIYDIEIVKPKNPAITQKYAVRVIKPDNSLCTLSNKSCEITYTFVMPQYSEYVNDCRFYFDNYKRITPDERTQKALDKGLNIFKYL